MSHSHSHSHSRSRSPHSQLSRPRTITRTSTSSRVTSNIGAPVVVSPTRLISLITQVVGVLGIAMSVAAHIITMFTSHVSSPHVLDSPSSSRTSSPSSTPSSSRASSPAPPITTCSEPSSSSTSVVPQLLSSSPSPPPARIKRERRHTRSYKRTSSAPLSIAVSCTPPTGLDVPPFNSTSTSNEKPLMALQPPYSSKKHTTRRHSRSSSKRMRLGRGRSTHREFRIAVCPGLEVILELNELDGFEGFEEVGLCDEFEEDGSEDSG